MILAMATETLPAVAAPACRASEQPMLRAELYFGRRIGSRARVTDRQWANFLDGEILPRFPDGLTVLDGEGRWRPRAGGASLRERTKVVMIVVHDEPDVYGRIDALIAAYTARFRQSSVGRVFSPVCASF
jgi:hypothetical protein